MSRAQSNTDVFYAIADPTRRSILEILRRGELPVSELAAHFEVTLSAISQHMRVLRDVELVTVRSLGRERLYQLNPLPLRPVSAWLQAYEPFWAGKLHALGDFLEAEDETKSD
ncbi:transcriptional regulator [Capsulimonas corticalis]|uniref:Transcriptional regulator n=1 Tax=Capsulimonas corticalis TaxID=2219043 RepID=A0A402CNZ3_9BACT|nr:metalloregulator ArsR/SmtB family transcription factor [Capsulimonas corticalis]BDI33274.1 transcriptional regulator [Capsulimonas corticalis]